MKNIKANMKLIVIMTLVLTSTSVLAQNLLINPSFESSLGNWFIGSWGGPTVTYSSTSEYVQDGLNAVKAIVPTGDTDAGKVFFRQQNLILSPTQEYIFSFYVLSNSAKEESIDLSFYSHTNMGGAAWGTVFSKNNMTFQGDGTWKKFEYTFTPSVVAGEPDFNKLAMSLSLAKNATTFYLDNFSLTTDAASAEPKTYFVSKDGSDANSGMEGQPFFTISKAASMAKAGDVVTIKAGTYQETLTPAKSGQNGNPIVFKAADGEKVIITAMEALSGWDKDEGFIYKTTVDWDLGQENFVMNGDVACDLARWPNNDDGLPFTLNSVRNAGGSGKDDLAGHLKSDQIPNYDWKNGGSIFFYGDLPGSGWTAWKSWITASSSGRVDFSLDKNPSWIRTFHYPAGLGDFYLEGVKEALDYNNEWYFDSNTKELFIQIPGGGKPQDGAIQMRKRDVTINLKNRSYIEIRNIAVMGGGIEINGTGNKLYGVSSFYGSMTRGVQSGFLSCKQAILVEGDSNVIEKCEVAFGDGSGIYEKGNDTQIINSRIHDFNMLGCYDAPMLVRGGNKSLIKNNEIFRGGRDAIQIVSTNSEVAYNNIHQSNLIADDCALLYTLGPDKHIKIHHNWFHDAQGRGKLKKAAGIYLDNDAGNIDVYNNVVWNTTWTNIQINWNGTDLNIFNNTLWDGSEVMGAWHKEGTAFSNVNVWNNLSNSSKWEEQADKQNNLTLSSDNPFVDMGNGDFTLRMGTPPIDYGRVIDGYTDDYVGSKPDVGAYEYGLPAWKAGIDWNPADGAGGLGCYGLPGDYCSLHKAESEKDTDGDAVTDDLDECPNTPPGKEVDAKGCEIVGIDDLASAYIRLFPNPVTDGRLILLTDGVGGMDFDYTIYTITGKAVIKGQLNNKPNMSKLNVSALTPGCYFILLSNGQRQVGEKFVKM